MGDWGSRLAKTTNGTSDPGLCATIARRPHRELNRIPSEEIPLTHHVILLNIRLSRNASNRATSYCAILGWSRTTPTSMLRS